MGFPGGTAGKEAASSGDIRDMSLISGLGRSPRGGHGNPLQHSCLENPKDRGTRWATIHGVANGRIQLKRLSMHIYIHTHTHTHTPELKMESFHL